jgi:hypothetical protein
MQTSYFIAFLLVTNNPLLNGRETTTKLVITNLKVVMKINCKVVASEIWIVKNKPNENESEKISGKIAERFSVDYCLQCSFQNVT